MIELDSVITLQQRMVVYGAFCRMEVVDEARRRWKLNRAVNMDAQLMATGGSGHCILNARSLVQEGVKRRFVYVTIRWLFMVVSTACCLTGAEFAVKTKVFKEHAMRILVQV